MDLSTTSYLHQSPISLSQKSRSQCDYSPDTKSIQPSKASREHFSYQAKDDSKDIMNNNHTSNRNARHNNNHEDCYPLHSTNKYLKSSTSREDVYDEDSPGNIYIYTYIYISYVVYISYTLYLVHSMKHVQ